MEETTDAVFIMWFVGSFLVAWFLGWQPKTPDIPLEDYEEDNQGVKKEDADNLC